MKNIFFRYAVRIARMAYGKGLGEFPALISIWEFLFAKLLRIHTVKVNFNNIIAWIDPADLGCGIGLLLKRDSFDEGIVRVFKDNLSRGMTVVDVGANIGLFSVLSANLVGKEGAVYSFEPNPSNFALFDKNIMENNAANIHFIKSAVSDKSGSVKLFTYPLRRAGSARGRLFGAPEQWPSVEVKTVSLDDYFAGRESEIDIIKMDIEGGEGKVIKGMKSILEKNRKLKIIMEFSPDVLIAAGTDPAELFNELLGYGFKIYDIQDEGLLPIYAYSSDGKGLNLFCVR